LALACCRDQALGVRKARRATACTPGVRWHVTHAEAVVADALAGLEAVAAVRLGAAAPSAPDLALARLVQTARRLSSLRASYSTFASVSEVSCSMRW
jgi:hypothetical protein